MCSLLSWLALPFALHEVLTTTTCGCRAPPVACARESGACSVESADTAAAAVAPVDPLSFNVRDNVQVKAVAYKLYGGCDGPQCSITL